MCFRILWIDTDNLLPPEDGFIPELRLCSLDCESIVSFGPRNIPRYYSTSGQNQAEENSDRARVDHTLTRLSPQNFVISVCKLPHIFYIVSTFCVKGKIGHLGTLYFDGR